MYCIELIECRLGNFSRLVVFFRFERQIGHHLIQTFAPSTLVVMFSWFSFWLDLDAIPGRVALLVTSMLTLVTMFTGLKSDIPPVAYVKVSTCMKRILFKNYMFSPPINFVESLHIPRLIYRSSITSSYFLVNFEK